MSAPVTVITREELTELRRLLEEARVHLVTLEDELDKVVEARVKARMEAENG
jgi:hypothetical protein